ncbi:hypothetical protein [Streptomyces sp. NPDC088915]|uniref:hypothetical protein n=1 Tax=Streptomyces sp. NPDC088915 TaxID=3365912 RepID=UPI00381DBF0D
MRLHGQVLTGVPDGAEERFEDGWNADVRAIATGLLWLADQTAAQRGRAVTHPLSPAPQPGAPAAKEMASAPVPGVREVLEVAWRCTWALTALQHFLDPDASEEIVLVALGAVREGEREGYAQRLQEFAEQYRGRLEWMLRGYGPGSALAVRSRP